MREVPLEDHPAAFEFAEKLFAGEIQGVILMTRVGTQTLIEALKSRYAEEEIVHALGDDGGGPRSEAGPGSARIRRAGDDSCSGAQHLEGNPSGA